MIAQRTAWPKATLQVIWRVVLFVHCFTLLSALFVVPFASLFSDWADDHPLLSQLFADFAGMVAILMATWIMVQLVDRRAFTTIGLSSDRALQHLTAGLAVGAGWLGLSIGVMWVAGWLVSQHPISMSSSLLLLAAASLCFNAITQQLLLCGYVFQTVRRRSNFLIAVLLSAGLFSAMHAGAYQGAWLPALNVFAAGVLFCLAYGIIQNLWFPIAIHFTWNFLLGPVFGLTVSGYSELGLGWTLFTVQGPTLYTGGAFGLEGGLIVTLATVVFIAAMTLIYGRQPRLSQNSDTYAPAAMDTWLN